MADKIKVVELFAGVGGFRLGLQRASDRYEIVWSNQWEPSTARQHASEIYSKHFGSESHFNVDISTLSPYLSVPPDLVVGGFPCQDYSVAKGFKASGIAGKKGALWWEIHRLLSQEESPPNYLFLENVDRLRNNPHSDRGRDFAIVLASLSDLGYIVEWRVIDSAEYGMPQRRKRIFLVAYQTSTPLAQQYLHAGVAFDWIERSGVLAKAFPITLQGVSNFELHGTLDMITSDFQRHCLGIEPENTASPRLLRLGKEKSPFLNAGLMVNRHVFTGTATAHWEGIPTLLDDVIEKNGKVPSEYFITPKDLPKWERLKGSKNLIRTHKETGTSYPYAEGAVTFPDRLDKPARTVVTGEGGSGASRFKHVIVHPANSEYRRLMPFELERLNMFPDEFTAGLSDTRRAFLMGNSVVVGVVEQIARELAERINN